CNVQSFSTWSVLKCMRFFLSSGISFFFQAEDGIRYRNVTGVQTCALPISARILKYLLKCSLKRRSSLDTKERVCELLNSEFQRVDRKSTRLNSSHVSISYAVFCLKKKN